MIVDLFGKELHKFDLVMVIYQRIDDYTVTLKKGVITEVVPATNLTYGYVNFTYGKDSESCMFADECQKQMIKIDDKNKRIFEYSE